MRVDGIRIQRPSTNIALKATLTIAYADTIRILQVLGPGTRRGPASEAQTLYLDLSPPPPKKTESGSQPTGGRDPGAGRPTKKQRRETDYLLGR